MADRPAHRLGSPNGYGVPSPSTRGRLRLSDPRRVRQLFDDAPIGIVALDLSGVIADCNRAFAEAAGWERAVAIGRPLVECVSREDRDDVHDHLSKLVMGTLPATRLEGVRIGERCGRERTVSLHAVRIDEFGEAIGLLIHVLDVTERQVLERKFAQSQRMQAIGQLAGGIAHDFNNLLTAMLGFCDLLLARHGPGDPSYADIVQVRGSAIRASDLVRQLLAFSRKQALKPVIVDVAAALRELSAMLGRLLGAQIDLRLDFAGDVGCVRVDPGQFDQVIVNLAVNARDAMPEGGALTLRTSRAHLAAPLARAGESVPPGTYVLIEVADTGVGIAKEILGNIFDPFFTTKPTGAGTGLGLSTVYGIVRQTGGFVFVDSAPGDGTVFSIYLPQVDAVATQPASGAVAAAEPDRTAAAIAASGSLLLVEDEAPVRMFTARALRGRGYAVIEAEAGESALEMLGGGDVPVDLLISDIVMPGLDGRNLARLARERRPDLRVILMSGYAEDQTGAGLPAVHFLQKPFSLAELLAKVKVALAE